MAEVIDEAVSAGVEQPAIISGLYDSIIKNYLNRVKGNRSVGKVIFCQGMPFSADALAAAVARQTGSEVDRAAESRHGGRAGHRAARGAGTGRRQTCCRSISRDFSTRKIEQKDTFVCGSNRGCGGAGNRCRIERLRTLVNSQRSNFTWGGGAPCTTRARERRNFPILRRTLSANARNC